MEWHELCFGRFAMHQSHAVETELHDQRLVERLLRHDDAAWREFHLLYDRLIHRCIVKVTGRFSSVLSSDHAAEIYSQLLVQMLSADMKKLRSFDATRGTKLSSWIGLLAVNAAYDYLRENRRQPARGTLMEAEELASADRRPDELYHQRELAILVDGTLAQFSDKDRQFVELYFKEGLAPECVAEAMNISVKTVYSKKHKIQARLHALLAAA